MEEQNRFSKVKELSKAKRAQMDDKSAAQKANKAKEERAQSAMRPKDFNIPEGLRTKDHEFDDSSNDRKDPGNSTLLVSSNVDINKTSIESTTVNIDVLTDDLCSIVGKHRECSGIAPYDPQTMEANDPNAIAGQPVLCSCWCHQ